jgi:hypothetical protein
MPLFRCADFGGRAAAALSSRISSRKREPNLRECDQFVAGFCGLFMKPTRLVRSAFVLKPSTWLNVRHALKNRKYRLLFSQQRSRKPGSKGTSKILIDAVVDIKRRDPA